jgi:hypothetical protein
MPSTADRQKVPALAAMLITLGTGWLLTVQKIVPGVNWVWVLGLAVAGLLIPIVGGVDKVTLVAGPFLMIAAGCSLLRQLDWMRADVEAPFLVIAAGGLLLLHHFLKVPAPKWLLEE